MSKATLLRDAMKAEFYPFAQASGFDRLGGNSTGFICFSRPNEGHLDVFDIQWGRDGDPRFVLNFGRCLPGDELEGWKPHRLQPIDSALHRGWFRLRKPLRAALKTGSFSYAPAEVVQQAIALFPEMEKWWADGTISKHVRAPSHSLFEAEWATKMKASTSANTGA